ncbi:UNVERIFIED_CONTAM: hypothetical protein FKN15_048156 [Acipenser sinensis]
MKGTPNPSSSNNSVTDSQHSSNTLSIPGRKTISQSWRGANFYLLMTRLKRDG